MDRRAWLTAMTAFGVGCAGCKTAPVTGRRQLMVFPETNEVEMGKQAFAETITEETKLSTPANQQLVKHVGDRIAQVSGRTDYDWETVCVASPEKNAFALPGGKMVVYEGILPVCQNEAGLAVVMSHEVAHVLARHGGERMSQRVAIDSAKRLSSYVMRNKEEAARETFSRAYGLATEYGLILPYSRKHESEADHIGLMLMSEAGYDPTEAPKFWTRFAGANTGAEQKPEFLSTHPADARRSSDLEKLLPEALDIYREAANPLGTGEIIA